MHDRETKQGLLDVQREPRPLSLQTSTQSCLQTRRLFLLSYAGTLTTTHAGTSHRSTVVVTRRPTWTRGFDQ